MTSAGREWRVGLYDLIDREAVFGVIVLVSKERVGQGFGHGVDGVAARTELGDAPFPAGARHQASVQAGTQPAVHQRGFAASGGPHDGQKVRGCQLIDHGVDLALPTKEEVFLFFVKRP